MSFQWREAWEANSSGPIHHEDPNKIKLLTSNLVPDCSVIVADELNNEMLSTSLINLYYNSDSVERIHEDLKIEEIPT